MKILCNEDLFEVCCYCGSEAHIDDFIGDMCESCYQEKMEDRNCENCGDDMSLEDYTSDLCYDCQCEEEDND